MGSMSRFELVLRKTQRKSNSYSFAILVLPSVLFPYLREFLVAFAKFVKTYWQIPLVCLSVSPHGKLSFHWKDFHELRYLIIFLKSVQKIKFSLQYDKNGGYFTWYIYDNILLNSSQIEKCFRQTQSRKSKHTFYV